MPSLFEVAYLAFFGKCWRVNSFAQSTGNPPYSTSPCSAVKRYSGKGDTTLDDTPPLRSAGRISSGAARRYHLVAVPPLDLGAMLTADRPWARNL